jgi:cation diffusion facilitator CzcD-associated flavoprotein CzcO
MATIAPTPSAPAGAAETADHPIAILGTGFAGLGLAIRLKRAGINEFVVLERADDVGGTWRDNTYPGCQCDIPSHLYSFSFAPNPNWSRLFPIQPEIWDYLRDVAQRFDLMPHIRFGHEVQGATWDEDAALWRIETAQGPLTARFVVAGQGGLSDPAIPDLPGLERFQGPAFHSAQWDHDHELDGERVAVIGTGASSIQFIPYIQPKVGKLTLFQRTPPWVMPHPDRPIRDSEKRLFRRLPFTQKLFRAAIYAFFESRVVPFTKAPGLMKAGERIALRHMAQDVPDKELRRKLTPHYRMGCKRVLMSNTYYQALAQPNAEVVTDAIREVRERSIVTADGVEHEVDTIIFGTGFKVTDLPMADWVRGRDGRTLAEVFQGSPEGYLGTTVAGFPNLFLLTGPNTGLGHNSIVYVLESQFNYVLSALRTLKRRGAGVFDVKPEVQQRYNAELQEQLKGTVWNTGGCSSWYLDRNGRNTVLWPTWTWKYRLRTRRFDAESYRLERVGSNAWTSSSVATAT